MAVDQACLAAKLGGADCTARAAGVGGGGTWGVLHACRSTWDRAGLAAISGGRLGREYWG